MIQVQTDSKILLIIDRIFQELRNNPELILSEKSTIYVMKIMILFIELPKFQNFPDDLQSGLENFLQVHRQ